MPTPALITDPVTSHGGTGAGTAGGRGILGVPKGRLFRIPNGITI